MDASQVKQMLDSRLRRANKKGDFMFKRVAVIFFAVTLCSCVSNKNTISTLKYDFHDGISQITHDLCIKLNNKNNLKVAIIPFADGDGNLTVLGESVANNLQVSIFNSSKNILLVERERIDSIYREINFALDGFISDDELYEIGHMLAVDAVLVGTIRDEEEYFSLYSRIVSVEKSTVLGVSQVLLRRESNLNNQYNKIVKYSNTNYSGGYLLNFHEAVFSDLNDNELPWDSMSRADVFFTIEINDVVVYKSKTYSDFPILIFNDNAPVVLNNNDKIVISIYDEDLTTKEIIGRIILSTDDIKYLIRNQKNSYSSDKIKRLDIELEKK